MQNTTPCGHNGESSFPDHLKAYTITLILSIIGSVLIIYSISYLINHLYNPDKSAALTLARNLSIMPIEMFNPEPKEKLIFLSGIVSTPLSLCLLFALTRTLVSKLHPKLVDRLFTGLLLSSVIFSIVYSYIVFSEQNPFFVDKQNAHDLIAKTNFQFFFISSFIYEHYLIYIFILFPLLFLLIWHQRQVNNLPALRINRLLQIILYVWSALIIIVVGCINIFEFPYTFENKYDFSAVFGSMVQVYHGLPLLVNNFTNSYGLYPHFIVPFFKLFGLTIASFSLLMSFITAVCFILLLLYLLRELSNNLIILLCFSSIAYYSHFYFKIITNYDSTFVSQPIRFVFPILSLYFSSIYSNNKSPLAYYTSLIILACGILWNVEFGITTYFAYILFLMYCEFTNNITKNIFRGVIKHIVCGFGAVCIIFSSYMVIIKAVYGNFPELSNLFTTLKMFSFVGFGMLEMPLLHPWNLIALIYIVALSITVIPLITKTSTPKDAKIFLVTLLGIASLLYYQGRSHNWNLMPTMVYSFILLAFFAESLAALAVKCKAFYLPLALIIFVLGSSFLQIGYSAPALARLLTESDNKAKNLAEQNMILANTRFIRENSHPGERILILVKDYYQGLYYGLADRPAAFNPGFIDLLWREDANRLRTFLITNVQTKVFYEPGNFVFYGDRIPELLSDLYEGVASNGQVLLLRRKRS